MKRAELIISIIGLLVAGSFYYFTFDFPKLKMQETGPAFMPRIYCGLLLFLSMVLLVQTIIKKGKEEGKENTLPYAIASMGFILVYIVLIPFIGFYISTLLVVFGLLFFQKVRNKWALIAVPLCTAFFVFIFFEKLLKVSIPLGSLFS